MNLPIFDWGRRRAKVRLNCAQADELVEGYQRTVQGAFQEVAAQTRTVEAQRRLARTARLCYDNGIAICLDALNAERNLFSAKQTLLKLRATDLQNSVSLYTALGGGVRTS